MGDTGLEPATPSVSCHPWDAHRTCKTPEFLRFYSREHEDQTFVISHNFAENLVPAHAKNGMTWTLNFQVFTRNGVGERELWRHPNRATRRMPAWAHRPSNRWPRRSRRSRRSRWRIMSGRAADRFAEVANQHFDVGRTDYNHHYACRLLRSMQPRKYPIFPSGRGPRISVASQNHHSVTSNEDRDPARSRGLRNIFDQVCRNAPCPRRILAHEISANWLKFQGDSC
jgi:hypothetical protein